MTFVGAGAIGVGAVCGWSVAALLGSASNHFRRAAVVAAMVAVAGEAALIGGWLAGAAALVGTTAGASLGGLWLRHLRARAGVA